MNLNMFLSFALQQITLPNLLNNSKANQWTLGFKILHFQTATDISFQTVVEMFASNLLRYQNEKTLGCQESENTFLLH